MDFATVFLDKNEKNISCQLLEKGLLRTNVSKSGDNASKYIEDLLAAEKKAVEGKVGVYSSGPAPIRVFNDTKFVDPNETDLCYTNDMVKVLCSSD
jgi:endonuclease YncB( thermonuclease family)